MTKEMNDYFEIEGYAFSNNVLETIKFLANKTKITGLETGFSLCQNLDTAIIYPKNMYIGTKYEITIEEMCDENEQFIGNFHTHPDGAYIASFEDLLHAYIEGVTIILGNKLVFYIRKTERDIEKYNMLYEYYNKYTEYRLKHGKLSIELRDEEAYIYKTFANYSFDIVVVDINTLETFKVEI